MAFGLWLGVQHTKPSTLVTKARVVEGSGWHVETSDTSHTVQRARQTRLLLYCSQFVGIGNENAY